MTIYSINPKSKINSNNIINIMSQLVENISYSINSINNIINFENYSLILNTINNVLNNYLKNYNFFNYGIKNIIVQIYNQNIEIVVQTRIDISNFNYLNFNSKWNDFYKGNYNELPKIVYNQLSSQQKYDLRLAIISGDLFYLDDIIINFDSINPIGIILKPKLKSCNECMNNYNNDVVNENNIYITTIYWY